MSRLRWPGRGIDAGPAPHLRARGEGVEQRASTLELFFDLVYVFAVTQIALLLHANLTFRGAGQALLLLLVVWWAWVYTTWMTNWFDPDSALVRTVLIGVMLASLLMAIALPRAFGDGALLFACSYAALQVVRNAFVVSATRPGTGLHGAFARILVWSVAVGGLWIAGALASGAARIALWVAAVAIDYAGPAAGYWLPRWGRSAARDWQIESGHFAERFQLFILIALGESIVVTGATASGQTLTAGRLAAIAVAFLGTAALWWLYFDSVAERAQRRLDRSENPGRIGRDAYTYLHLPLVAGIIAAAVGNEIVIAHPGETLGGAKLLALAGGPVLYLLGHVAFRLRIGGSVSRKRLGAAAAIAAIGALGAMIPALAAATLMTGALVALIVVEMVAWRRGRKRTLPRPLERLAAAAGEPARDAGS
jgi:low temperature requirement protein LtrA